MGKGGGHPGGGPVDGFRRSLADSSDVSPGRNLRMSAVRSLRDNSVESGGGRVVLNSAASPVSGGAISSHRRPANNCPQGPERCPEGSSGENYPVSLPGSIGGCGPQCQPIVG